MKRPALARLQALASRHLLQASARLLGSRQASWARAMQAETEAIPDEGEALAFAWGCLRAAASHAVVAVLARLAQPHSAGVLACTATVLLGCAFMHSAGAPAHYALMNLLSLALAVATFGVLPRQRLAHDESLRGKLSFAIGGLLLAASLGLAPGGPSAWLSLGPVHLNLPWLLLPALLVATGGQVQRGGPAWALGSLLMACGALVLLADPVLLGLVAGVLGLRAWRWRHGALALLAAATWAAALHAWPGWQAPEAMLFADQVVQGALAHSLALGLAMALLQLLPLWPGLLHRQARWHGLVWGLLLLLSLPGWVSSPLVGFGGSFIVGYMLSLALLPGAAARQPAANPAPAATRHRQRPPIRPRSGLV